MRRDPLNEWGQTISERHTMSTTVLIEIAEEQIPFELDFTTLTWTAEREIRSDGTFSEEEL